MAFRLPTGIRCKMSKTDLNEWAANPFTARAGGRAVIGSVAVVGLYGSIRHISEQCASASDIKQRKSGWQWSCFKGFMRYGSIILLSAGLHLAWGVPLSSARRPLSFEPNVGQANPRVKFLAHSGARAIYVTSSGLEISGAEFQFRGGKCNSISGLLPLSERHNYFRGSSSRPKAVTDIPTYGRVRCEQIYRGIDAEFYGDRGSLEYDLIVAPHADSSVVRLVWKYAKHVQIERDGDLIIDTPAGRLRQHKPVVYQVSKRERQIVHGGYVLAGDNEVRLSLGAYDQSLPLVIDPVIDSVLFAVDANAAPAGPMAVDSSGNIYLTGYTQTSSFESTAGSVQPAFGGGPCEYQGGDLPPMYYPCPDAYVIKLDSNGGVIYATFLGGDGADEATSIAVDSSGNAYIAGTTNPNPGNPNNFPITPGAAFPKPSVDGLDAFVAKLNATGDKLIYSTFIPELSGAALAVDAQGAAYIVGTALPPSSGSFGSTGFPTTPGAFQTTSTVTGGVSGVAKLNSSGTALVYATYLGGSNPEVGYFEGASGIAVDAQGDAYVTGSTSAPDFPTTPGAFNRIPSNVESTVYVSKLNPTGSALIYSTFLGDGGGEGLGAIKLDAKGNAYVVGDTDSSSFPVTAGAFQPSGAAAPWALSYSGTAGRFLSALNADGTSLIYSTYLTGAGVAYDASPLDVDAAGDAYVVGVASYNFPVTSGAFQRCLTNGTGDLFVVEFNPSGQAIGATYLGGTGSETPSAIVAGPNGSPYIAGTTTSTDFPGIIGAEQGVALTFVTQIQINNSQTTDGPCISQILENSASFAEGLVAPGELVTIRGAGIGPVNGVAGAPGSAGTFPTQLAGVQVSFDGFPAPLLYVQAQQINTVVPWEVAGDYESSYQHGTQVSVKIGSVSTNTFINPLAAAAPGIFAVNAANQAAVLNQDGTPNSPSNPAAAGSIIAIYGTGGGPTSPMGRTGEVAPLIQAPLTLPVAVQINGQNADVIYAGAAPGLISGVIQINVRIPDTTPPGPAYYLGVSIGSLASPMQPTIAVQ